jgi:hypothetical protein
MLDVDRQVAAYWQTKECRQAEAWRPVLDLGKISA